MLLRRSLVCRQEVVLRDIRFGFETLAVKLDLGVARWWASFVRNPPGLKTKLDGVFVISLAAATPQRMVAQRTG